MLLHQRVQQDDEPIGQRRGLKRDDEVVVLLRHAQHARVVQARDALNSLVNLTVEGHAGRYDWVRLMNLRVSKVVKVGRHSLEGMLDGFNMLNSNVVLSQVNTNGPNYLKPLPTGTGAATAEAIPAPRIFRISLRYMF